MRPTPRTDAQQERDNTLVSAGQRIAEWRDLSHTLERENAELLEALEQAERVFRKPPDPDAEIACLAVMRAAIAKARGEA